MNTVFALVILSTARRTAGRTDGRTAGRTGDRDPAEIWPGSGRKQMDSVPRAVVPVGS